MNLGVDSCYVLAIVQDVPVTSVADNILDWEFLLSIMEWAIIALLARILSLVRVVACRTGYSGVFVCVLSGLALWSTLQLNVLVRSATN